MVRRRIFLRGLLLGSGPLTGAARLRAQTAEALDTALDAYFSDETALEQARAFREYEFRSPGLTAEVQSSGPRRRASTRRLPRTSPAWRLIVGSEVTSERVYSTLYTRPYWPGLESGVTIGIGYDLGFVRPGVLAEHWQGLLTVEQLRTLSPVCRLRGDAARRAIPAVQAVSIPWDDAVAQFERFLPYVVGDTEDTFDNCELLSDLSFGALVSLVYNRGSNVSESNPRRREMHEIWRLMSRRQFAGVPAQIRAMHWLWDNDPRARGLLRRRELEAQMFEQGLA